MLIPLYVFLGVSLLFFAVAMLLVRAGSSGEGEVFAAGQKRPMAFGPLTPALSALLPVGKKTRKRLSLELCQAGYYHRHAVTEYLALRNTLVVGWVLLVGTVLVVGSEPGGPLDLQVIGAGVLGLILLYAIPRLTLGSRAKARIRRIEYSLPDALDMLSMCMTGGLTFSQSLARVGSELARSYPDLACELRIVGRQADSGTLSRAIKGFSERVDTPEVQSLASVIGQTERHGGAVAPAFHQFARDVRRQRRQLAEERGNRTSIHMLFPLVLCLAPPVYLLLLAPAAIELRGFVTQENRPGGLLSPTVSLQDAAATPTNTPLQRIQ